MKNKNLDTLLEALSASLSDEELLLSVLQADIAATITSTRVSKGMSQKDLANALNVSQGLVSKWESGDTNYTLETLVRIAMQLDIDMRSPYAPDRQPHYSTSGNVVDFPSGTWTGVASKPQKWTKSTDAVSTYELEEM